MVVEVVKKTLGFNIKSSRQGSQGVMRRLTLWERRKEEKGEEFPFISFFCSMT